MTMNCESVYRVLLPAMLLPCIIGCPPGAVPVCGDNVCGLGENLLCPTDCVVGGDGGSTADRCGNGVCDGGENVSNCADDCGAVGGEICGNGFCGTGENVSNCPQDCGGAEECGDGFCGAGENSSICPADCIDPANSCLTDADCDDRDGCTDDLCVDGECESIALECFEGGVCNSVTGECEEVVEEDFCGNGSCGSEEDGQACPSDCADFERFLIAVENARSDRVADASLGLVEISRGETREETNDANDRLTEFTEVIQRRTTALDNLVMTDNTIGKVFPGSLLWAAPIRDGRLGQVEQIPGRPPVTTSFTLVRDVEPRPIALTFDHNGSFSSFLTGAADVFGAVGSGGTRVAADFKISSSVEDALLSIGMSAKFWGSSVTAGLSTIQSERRSVAIMTLDQVFYSSAVDIPNFEGFLPQRLIRGNSQLARALADGAERDGEIVYVRKVDYGRRILVSLSAESSSDELDIAVDTAIKVYSGEFTGELDRRTKEVWDSVEGKLIIIGGTFPPGISGFFGGDLNAFVNTIQSIMTADFINDTQGAVPVSFELAYLNDNSPMQVFETAEFAGKIPGRSWGKVSYRKPFETTPQDAVVIRSDNEMRTDDWTMVQMESQDLRLSPDRRTILFDIVWNAWEGESNMTIRGDRTAIESRLTKAIDPGGVVREFIGPTSFGAAQQWFRGGISLVPQAWGNHGFLENIRVVVDGPGGNDSTHFRLNATLIFEYWLED